MLYLLYVIHVLSCFWVLLGFLWNPDGSSWFTSAGLPPTTYKGKGSYFEQFESISVIYIRAIYFIVTSLTTVGYGDIKGVTNYELLFQMGLEFIGIAFFSLLMSSINNILVQESKVQDIIDEKIDQLETWIRKLDQSRGSGKHLPKSTYDSIKNYVEASFLLDFS